MTIKKTIFTLFCVCCLMAVLLPSCEEQEAPASSGTVSASNEDSGAWDTSEVSDTSGDSNVSGDSDSSKSISIYDQHNETEYITYTPMDNVDYTLERIELPLEKDYEKMILGYFKMQYKNEPVRSLRVAGRLDPFWDAPLQEKDRILPTYYPEAFTMITKDTDVATGIYTSINAPSTTGFGETDLVLEQNKSPEFLKVAYSPLDVVYAAKVGEDIYLLLESQYTWGNRYTIFFDDGKYCYGLIATSEVSLDEMMKMVVSMNRPTRSVKSGFGADELDYPNIEKIELDYTYEYVTTEGRYRYEYSRMPGGFSYQSYGDSMVTALKLPKLSGYSAAVSESGNFRYTNENGDVFTYRVDRAGRNVIFRYCNGTSFYEMKLGEYDAIVLYRTVDGVQRDLGLFFSDGEYDYALQTHGDGIKLETLVAAANSIGKGEKPTAKVEELYSVERDLEVTSKNVPAFLGVSVCEFEKCCVFTLRYEYQKAGAACRLWTGFDAYKSPTKLNGDGYLFHETMETENFDGVKVYQVTYDKDLLEEDNCFLVVIAYDFPIGEKRFDSQYLIHFTKDGLSVEERD